MVDWQPIETIPRDGTPIIAYCDGPNNCGAEICAIRFDVQRSRPGWDAWRVCGTEEILHWSKPLKWMPQPAPPVGVFADSGDD